VALLTSSSKFAVASSKMGANIWIQRLSRERRWLIQWGEINASVLIPCVVFWYPILHVSTIKFEFDKGNDYSVSAPVFSSTSITKEGCRSQDHSSNPLSGNEPSPVGFFVDGLRLIACLLMQVQLLQLLYICLPFPLHIDYGVLGSILTFNIPSKEHLHIRSHKIGTIPCRVGC
jgi:hypothetical protein